MIESKEKISFDLSLLKDYKQYPLKAAPSGLVNSLSTYFPVFFINNYFDSRSAGFYFLIEKLLLAPISLISNAFSNVYRERAQKEFYLHKNYFNVTIKTIKLLVFISLIVFSLLALLNQFLVTNFLSKEWFEIITLIYIFIPFFAVKFISGPLMSGLYVKNRLGLDLIFQFVYLIVIIFSCLFGFYYGSIKSLILCLSLLGSTYFSFLILINYKLSK